ncbi:hypothetical protein BDV18DRAFT_136334 [Aspergillus unguis]
MQHFRYLSRIQRRCFVVSTARMNSVAPWTQLHMPGYNVPLNYQPRESVIRKSRFGFGNALDPNHIDTGYINEVFVFREIVMMRIMDKITDKPDWHRKVFDERITDKWRAEIAESDHDVSTKMMDWVIKELQWKSEIFNQSGYVEVFDHGVVKSDTAISPELQQSLKDAVAPLEDVADDEKDYHPASDGKVIDLVHPSLFPLVFNQTRVIPDRVLGLDDCLDNTDLGVMVPAPPHDDTIPKTHRWVYRNTVHPPVLSHKFQWLPAEVELLDNGDCRIASYINNAHPITHRTLYEAVEKIVAKAIPLWERSLREAAYWEKRIPFTEVEYEEDSETEPEFPEDFIDQAHEDAYWELSTKWWASRRIIQPEPGEFKVNKPLYDPVDFRKHFPDQHLQVIVKLANIELTPDKPEYEGGTWHIEGQLNERIAASAIYYYDNENITPSSLAFRHRAEDDFMDVSYEQDQHHFVHQVYGFPEDVHTWSSGLSQPVTQELGGVETKEGRLITFPNTVQHRVSPFSLADRSKPGHRKILALFLVDPHHRIISTANVPPQREDWYKESRDPSDHTPDGDTRSTMTMEEAKALRLELMEERGLRSEEHNAAYEMGSFSLCEH